MSEESSEEPATQPPPVEAALATQQQSRDVQPETELTATASSSMDINRNAAVTPTSIPTIPEKAVDGDVSDQPPVQELTDGTVLEAISDGMEQRSAEELSTEPRFEVTDFTKWRETQMGWLNIFLRFRLLHRQPQASIAPDYSTQDPQHPQQEPAEEFESQSPPSLETQQEQPAAKRARLHEPGTQPPSAAATPNKAMPLIPHTHDLVRQVTLLEDLDLHTHQLSLALLMVQKMVSLRRTYRRQVRQVAERLQFFHTTPVNENALPRITLYPLEDDGPLRLAYRTVFTLEVQQLLDSSQRSPLRPDITRTQKVQRLKLFLHNNYANAMANVVQQASSNQVEYQRTHNKGRQDKKSLHRKPPRLVAQLVHVPSKCIFPQHAADWFDQHDLAPFCVCLGDESFLNIGSPPSEHGVATKDRYDSPDLVLRVGVLVAATQHEEKGSAVPRVAREWEIGPCCGKKLVRELVDPQDQVLTPLWNQHCELQRKDALRGSNMSRPGAMPSTGTTSAVTTTDRTMTANTISSSANRLAVASTNDRIKPACSAIASVNVVGSNVVSLAPQPVSAVAPNPPPQAANPMAATVNPSSRSDAPRMPSAMQQKQPEIQWLNPEVARKRAVAVSKDQVQAPKVGSFNLDETKYFTLSELENILDVQTAAAGGTKVDPSEINAFGVVLAIAQPSQTKRQDWFLSVTLVDESLKTNLAAATQTGSEPTSIQSVNINIFTKNKSELPQVCYGGDVMRLHRVKVQKWDGKVQLLGKRSSSYVVYRGPSNQPDVQLTRDDSRQSWTSALLTIQPNRFSDEMTMKFISMWKWGQQRFFNSPTMKPSETFQIGDMQPSGSKEVELYHDKPNRGDLTVMVSMILDCLPRAENFGEVLPKGFIRVWDGTGPPISDPMPVVPTQSSLEEGDPPKSALLKVGALIQTLRHTPGYSTLRVPKALSGRVVNVAIWEEQHWVVVKSSLQPGCFIRLRNVHDSVFPGKTWRCLMVGSKTHLTPLPNLTFEVVRILERHQARLDRNDSFNPQSGVLPLESGDSSSRQGTSRNHRNIEAFASVSTVADLVSGPIPTFYHGQIRIRETIPNLEALASGKLEDIVRAKGFFGAYIEDESGEAQAIIDSSSLGENLASDDLSRDQFRECVRKLVKIFRSGELLKAKASSVVYRGSKYFILSSISTVE